MSPREDATVTRFLVDEAATVRLGHELATMLAAGDCLCLKGELGSGKTTLARALIHALSPKGAAPEVPSPTFTLVQTYDDTRIPVAHYDCYRLKGPEEILETGLEDDLDNRLVLIEWPERVASCLPADRLTVRLAVEGEGRRAVLTASGTVAERLARFEVIAGFLDASGWGDAGRGVIAGDASTRRYERLTRDGETCLLMDMPARPDGLPVKDGKPYSRLVHLAEDCRAVVAVNEELLRRGYSAPAILAHDMDAGLLLIEDLGDWGYGRMIAEGQDIAEPMLAAVMVLADMAGREWPTEAPLPDGSSHRLMPYDAEALITEADLLIDWFWPLVMGKPADAAVTQSYGAAWREVLPLAAAGRPVWVLRDYHSPNLIWLPQREGLARVGLIDTQDAVLGHPAYDLVSLLRDARLDVPAEVETDYFDYYVALRATEEEDFDLPAFEAAYAVLGAQRAAKILGIFARLSRRDGKHGYLRHLRRVSGQLEAGLAHPALSPVARWFAGHLPKSTRDTAIAALNPPS